MGETSIPSELCLRMLLCFQNWLSLGNGRRGAVAVLNLLHCRSPLSISLRLARSDVMIRFSSRSVLDVLVAWNCALALSIPGAMPQLLHAPARSIAKMTICLHHGDIYVVTL